MATQIVPDVAPPDGSSRQSLPTSSARTLATTTKTVPKMQGISPRWLMRTLPWVEVSGGIYRVNRRMSFAVGDGRVTFLQDGAQVRVIPEELRELAMLRDVDDDAVLAALAERFVQREFAPGEAIVQAGTPADEICLIAHGKVEKIFTGRYGEAAVRGVLADGDHFTSQAILETDDTWPFTARCATRCIVLTLSQAAFEDVMARSPALRSHIEALRTRPSQLTDRYGQAEIELAAGHEQEDDLPRTYVDYEPAPREYEMSVTQTVLRVHTRVADLFNDPIDQTREQLRLTIEALRERQEHEMVNNRSFGLLHNAAFSQRIQTRTGPPAPQDLDELLTRRRKTRLLIAHPRGIAAFHRECTRRGVYPQSLRLDDRTVPAWRGVPLLPCNKIPIAADGTTSILAMRLGEEDQGVVALQQTGLPDEYQPGLSVRFVGIDDKGIISYLVSAYYSAAVLIPDALGILDNVQI